MTDPIRDALAELVEAKAALQVESARINEEAKRPGGVSFSMPSPTSLRFDAAWTRARQALEVPPDSDWRTYAKEDEANPCDVILRQRGDIDALMTLYRRALKDSERYQWWRDVWLSREGDNGMTIQMCRAETADEFDTAVDAVLAGQTASPVPPDSGEPGAIAHLLVLMDRHDMGQSLAPNPPFKSHRIHATKAAEELPLGKYALYLHPAPAGDAAIPARQGEAVQGWSDVLAERKRQMEVEDWTPDHDDDHHCFELSLAAACYAVGALDSRALQFSNGNEVCPWDFDQYKPKDQRFNLVRAAALLLAEIERLDRAAPPTTPAAPKEIAP